VRVFNDNVSLGRRPKLIGQWFMTLKWLWQCPEHCKHSSLTPTGDGGIAGTFLLTDAKLHGSAVRGRGPRDAGTGFSGELDMAVQWTHSPLVDPMIDPPEQTKPAGPGGPAAHLSAIDQLGSTGDDDGLRFGNWGEFKAWLHGIPIRFDIDHFALRRLKIEMSDLFIGVGAGVDDSDTTAYIKSMELNLGRVSMYEFFDVLATKIIGSVAVDARALYTATSEVLSGLGINLSKQVGNALASTAAVAATPLAAVASSAAAAATAAASAGASATSNVIGYASGTPKIADDQPRASAGQEQVPGPAQSVPPDDAVVLPSSTSIPSPEPSKRTIMNTLGLPNLPKFGD